MPAASVRTRASIAAGTRSYCTAPMTGLMPPAAGPHATATVAAAAGEPLSRNPAA